MALKPRGILSRLSTTTASVGRVFAIPADNLIIQITEVSISHDGSSDENEGSARYSFRRVSDEGISGLSLTPQPLSDSLTTSLATTGWADSGGPTTPAGGLVRQMMIPIRTPYIWVAEPGRAIDREGNIIGSQLDNAFCVLNDDTLPTGISSTVSVIFEE